MNQTIKKPELLAPAGDLERLQAALDYGADAVYLAGKAFGMRSAPSNFTNEELREGVRRAHAKGVKVYVTCNTLRAMRSSPRSRIFSLSAPMPASTPSF